MTMTEFKISTTLATKHKLSVKRVPIDARTDGMADWGKGTQHFLVALAHDGDHRGAFVFEYSQGSAYTEPPSLADIVGSLLLDTRAAEKGIEEYFVQFCTDKMTYQEYKNAEKAFEQSEKAGKWLKARFSEAELDGLQELLADY